MKLALITGATGGLGKALAHLLAIHGFSLLLSARNNEALQQLAEELGPQTLVKWVACDLSQDLTPLLRAIEETVPDLVINNAGFGFYGPFEELEGQVEMIQVNVTAPLCIMQAVINTLKTKKKEGIIMNIGSAAGYFALPFAATYAASKAFLQGLSEAVDEELKGSGIRVLISCPGQIDTPFRIRASKGQFIEKQGIDIPVQKAAKAILKQIQKGRRSSIIDWRYRLAVLVSCCLPKQWLQKKLAATLSKRFRIAKK